jgi:hypothetical protein
MYESAAACQEVLEVPFDFSGEDQLLGTHLRRMPERDVIFQRRSSRTLGIISSSVKDFSLAAVDLQASIRSIAHLLVLAVSS